MVKNSNPLSLSIVIPVYNEERYLKHCLSAIAAQTEAPEEVIVVNNNSTDRSMEIARKFSFVKIIAERRQSQVYAQKTGFDAATGQIIGRIDGDTMLPTDWVAKVKKVFAEDSGLVAVTGQADPYDIYLRSFGVFIFRTYTGLASMIAGCRMLWGANCAIRADAWSEISDHALQRADIWEDFDISFLLAERGQSRLVQELEAGTSFRAIHKSAISQIRYQFRWIRTFYLRTSLLRTIMMSVVWCTIFLIYPIILLDSYILKPLAGFKDPYK